MWKKKKRRKSYCTIASHDIKDNGVYLQHSTSQTVKDSALILTCMLCAWESDWKSLEIYMYNMFRVFCTFSVLQSQVLKL